MRSDPLSAGSVNSRRAEVPVQNAEAEIADATLPFHRDYLSLCRLTPLPRLIEPNDCACSSHSDHGHRLCDLVARASGEHSDLVWVPRTEQLIEQLVLAGARVLTLYGPAVHPGWTALADIEREGLEVQWASGVGGSVEEALYRLLLRLRAE